MTAPESRQRIGLMGGTFDPVHHGHLIVAEWLSAVFNIDQTFFIPTHHHPFDKRENITPARHRLAMLSRAIAPFPGFQISEYELNRPTVSFTIDTLSHFREKFPGSDLYLFMGRDNLESFLKWKEPFKILEMAYLAVYSRPNHNQPVPELENHPKILLIDRPVIDISSSHIRHRIRKNLPYRSLVPQRVFEYITNHHLYTS